MRISLFGQATEGRSKQVSSQARVNVVVEQSGDKGELTAYQRNGTELFATLAAGFKPKSISPWVIKDTIDLQGANSFLVVGSTSFGDTNVFQVTSAGASSLVISSSVLLPDVPIGKIATGNVLKQFAFVRAAYGIGANVYYWENSNPTVLQSIAITGTPPGLVVAPAIAYLDSRFYILSTSTDGVDYIRWSPLNGGTYNATFGYSVWNALDFISHGFGVGLGIFTYGDSLICFFSKGIVFYQTTTDPNLPISRVGSLLNNYRLESVNSVAISGDLLCFLGSQTNRRGVFAVRGYSVERISTPDAEEALSAISPDPLTIGSCCGFFANLRGHECYILTCPSIVLYYDFTSGAWGELARNPGQNIWQFGATFGTLALNSTVLLGNVSNNVISRVSNTLFSDNGASNTVTLISPVIYDETSEDRLSCSRVRIDVDYIAKGSVQPSLQVSRDGGKTFGAPIVCNPPGYTVDGTRINRLEFRRIGGRARDWRFKLTYTGENPITIVDAFAEFEK